MEVRPCRDRDEFARALYGIFQYFGPTPADDVVDSWIGLVGADRMHAAFEDGEVVGGAGVFTFDFSVPGGSLPCAGVTVVGVYPTHRRRGILREMMRAQLDDVHARGEPIAALWASEETIYGRFGYGLASWCGEISVPRDRSAYREPFERRGRVRAVTLDEAVELFPPVWEALRAHRTGVFARTETWWRERVLRTSDEQKATPKRLVALEIDGELQAYAIYRTTAAFEGFVSNARLDVVEAVGANPQATAEIWRYLLDVDWMATINAARIPPDHPLFFLLANPRYARFKWHDALWVRLVDVGAALSGRAYATEGSLVFEVRDAFCPWNEGRWKLEGGSASPTEDPADIALDVDALGSAYLGAVSLAQLREALRVEEHVPGAVARADALFGWHPGPWCPEIF
ncbi:MAG: GNAT family N-acetyltransferase [Actinobacteria bacterium]|nr:MAG: GNAT family N-acetyltransferase [Actinomycetota bacterium]